MKSECQQTPGTEELPFLGAQTPTMYDNGPLSQGLDLNALADGWYGGSTPSG